MAHTLLPISKLNGGEFSPSMDARFDLPEYSSAARRLRNLIAFKQGGVTRRPGTQYIANGVIPAFVSANPAVSRLQKFQFAPGTAFMLEFGHQQIRFFVNGAQVQVSGVSAWVSGTSYPAGAYVTFSGVTYFAFAGPVINSTTAPNVTPSQWVPQTAYAVPSPYSAINFTAPDYWTADVFVLQVLQINDVVYIVHPNYPVYKLTRFSNTNWTLQQVQFLTPAMMDENATDETLTASATSGSGVTLTATAAAWVTATYYVPGNSVTESGLIYTVIQAHTSGTFTTDLANGLWKLVTTFQAGHVGSYWQLAYNRPSSFIEFDAGAIGATYSFGTGTWYPGSGPSQLYLIGSWEIQTYGTWQGDATISVSYDNGTTFQVITTLTSRGDANFSISGQELNGGIYKFTVANTVALASTTPPRIVLTADNQFVYGLVQITAVANPYSATCTVVVPLYSTSATAYWSEGAWSDVRGYPQALTVFQERVWYGYSAAEPQRVWATQTDDIENFAIIDQSQATYGLAFDLNAAGRGPIQWLAAQTDLFVGLASAEWVITSGATTTAITATAIQALEHTVNGSAPALPALIIGQAAFYVQRKGRSFQQMLFSVFTNKYMSQDMQVTSQHLTNAGIQQFDYQQQFQEQSLLWAVCGDGSLICMTYAMEQKIFAWSKQTTGDGTDVGFLSVQVIYGAAGADDEVWVSCYRAGAVSGGFPFCTIERLNPVDWQTANVGLPALNQAIYADCSITATSPDSNIISTVPTILNGRTVVASIVPVSGSGMWSIRNLVVTAGAVTIPNYIPVTGDVVVVGLPINWVVQPMRLDLTGQGPIPGITKSLEKLYLRTLNSIGGQWATKQGDVIDIQAYPITTNSNQPPPFYPNITQDIELDVGGLFGYSLDPEFSIQGFDPLPFNLLGVFIMMDVGGVP